ncbi:MAG TPA: ABC transporter permease [Bacillota bacterium]|nr:ABC transporter permease [Bacillota bacterium]
MKAKTQNESLAPEQQPESSSGLPRRLFAVRELTLVAIIAGFGLILSFASPHFFSIANLSTTAVGLSSDGIIAIGMTVALVLGGLDLSVGSVMAFSSVVAGALYLNGVNIWLAALIALTLGMCCGLINGYFIGRIGLNPFITTLGMMSVARGCSYVLTQGSPLSLSGLDRNFAFLGSGSIGGVLPTMVVIFIVLTVVMDFAMRRSAALRQVFYTGSSEKAAELSGIDVSKVKFGVFFLTSLLASLAGILTLARFTVAAPNTGISAEMRAIAACVIGGCSLSGGEGTVIGAVLGVILLGLVNNALILLNVSVYWQELITGVILLVAVLVDFIAHHKLVKLS